MFTLQENKYQKKGTTFKFYYFFSLVSFQLFIKFFVYIFWSIVEAEADKGKSLL